MKTASIVILTVLLGFCTGAMGAQGTYVADWTTTNLGDCFWFANYGLDSYYGSGTLYGNFDDHPFVADPATNSLHIVVPDASNTYGQGFSNISGTKTDWGASYPLHFPFTVTYKVKPSQWPGEFGMLHNLLILGKPVETLFADGHGRAGIECKVNDGSTATVVVRYTDGDPSSPDLLFVDDSLLTVRCEFTETNWRLSYDVGSGWEYPAADPSFVSYFNGVTYTAEDSVAFYVRAWTGISPTHAFNLDMNVYDLAITADTADFPECASTGPGAPVPVVGLVGLAALAMAVAGGGVFAVRRRK